MQNYEPIKLITSQPEWNAVEQILETYISEFFDLRNVDTKLSAPAYKTECLSRLRAAENVLSFYRTNHFTSKRVEDIKGSFK